MGSTWARYVGSSLLAVQRARAREMVKVGLSARQRDLSFTVLSNLGMPPVTANPNPTGC